MRRWSLVLALALAACSESENSDKTLGVVRPSDGEVLVAGTQQSIAWRAEDQDVETVDIWLTDPDGNDIAVASGVTNNGAYTWEVPLLQLERRADFSMRVVRADASRTSSLQQGLVGRRLQHLEGGSDVDHTASGLAVGALADLQNDEQKGEWRYYWIDVLSGETRVFDAVGDLSELSQFSSKVADNGAKRLYVIGRSDSAEGKVYTLDSVTGELVSQVPFVGQAPSAIAIDADGRLLGFRWNGEKEEVLRINTTNGEQTVIGTVGDLASWSSEVAVHAASDRVYVLGSPSSGVLTLYVLVSTTGTLERSVPLSLDEGALTQLSSLTVNSSGAVLGFLWNDETKKEQMLQIDPSNGEATVLGTVGDLASWSMTAVVNTSNDNLYAFGRNDANVDKLYVMDAGTGGEPPTERLLYDAQVERYPSAALLVH